MTYMPTHSKDLLTPPHITAAHFTVATLSSPHRCPLTTQWIKKDMVYTHIRGVKNNKFYKSCLQKTVQTWAALCDVE